MTYLVGKHKDRDIAIEAVYFDPAFLDDFVDEVVCVERPKEEVIKYLIEERGFSREMAERAWGMVWCVVLAGTRGG